MRSHLLQCYENEKIEPFPKQYPKLRSIKIESAKKLNTVALWCICGMPKLLYDDMVGCESKRCRKWYHNQCIGVQTDRDINWTYSPYD